MRIRITSCVFYILLTFFMVVGCKDGSRPKDLPPLCKASITIIQDGQGLEGATVNLVPDVQSKWSVGGVTDANGVCNLRTHGQFDGAPEGQYKVLIQKMITELPEPTPNTPKTPDGTPLVIGTSYSLVPGAFSDVKKTTFTIQISKKGENAETFDIGGAVKIKK